MKYLTSISFPGNESLYNYMDRHTYQDWPFNVFLDRGLSSLYFKDVTILYGNNGSGKSTILTAIGEKIKASRKKPIFKDKKYFDGYEEYVPFDDYLVRIRISLATDPETGYDVILPKNIKLITSDDIFTKINDTIKHNNIANMENDQARDIYFTTKGSPFQMQSLDDYDELVLHNKVKRMSVRQFQNEKSRRKHILQSNGETAIDYFEDIFEPDGIYILDEPENCLSPVYQIELIRLITQAERYLNCQFIIATHSPLILSIPDAIVYDLDHSPVSEKPWYELDNVKVYYNFFKKNEDKFQ